MKLSCDYFEAEEATDKTFPAEIKGAARPEESNDLALNLPLGDPSLRGVRNASAVAPREPRVGNRLAIITGTLIVCLSVLF